MTVAPYDHPTYKKVFIRPTKRVHPTSKSVHPTYNWIPSDLQKEYIRPTKRVHPTCKSVHSNYKKCISDLQKVYIRLTKSVHLTYKKRAYRCLKKQLAACTWLKLFYACRSDLKKIVQPTYRLQLYFLIKYEGPFENYEH